MPKITRRKILIGVVGVVAAAAVLGLSQFGLWHVINPPPRYHIPESATSDEERAVKVAQDAVRQVKGRFVELAGTSIFKNHLGNHRIRGTVNNLLSGKKEVVVYEAIVDPKSFECLEFRAD